MKTIIKYSIYATVLAFAAIYTLRAMDTLNVKPEAVKVFEQENSELIKATGSYVDGVEKRVKNFKWEEFKRQVQEALGTMDTKINNVESTANYVAENVESNSKELEQTNNSVEEFEERLDDTVESQEDYQETIDQLESRINEVIEMNKDKDRKRLRLVNAKKISRLEKKLFRTNNEVKKEKIRDLIIALGGDY